MVIALAILSLFLSVFLAFVFVDAADSKFRNMDCAYWDNNLLGWIFAILSVILLITGATLFYIMTVKSIPQEEHRYPALEYRIETEITTRGEVSDTTYVISKIK